MPWSNQYGFNYKNMVFRIRASRIACRWFWLISVPIPATIFSKTSGMHFRLPTIFPVSLRRRRMRMMLIVTGTYRSKGAGCRIITPSMLGDYVNRQALEQETQHYLADYSAMIIGVGHATVIYRTTTGFVHVIPSRTSTVHVEHYANLDLDVVEHQGQHAVRVINRANGQPIIAGTFVMLLRP